ncbi:MAG: transcription factor [Candidatus Woesearchaeota archaeon]
MKLSDKEIEDIASKVAGEDVIKLIKTLKNKKNVSEFKLAEALKTEINLTRNMLYRLYDANLVSFIRKKDKAKGWYIYYWTFNKDRIQYIAKQLKNQRLDQLKERLAKEKSSNFFTCKNTCIRLNFEQATDFEFKCPECGELLEQIDNTKKILEIEKEIKKLEGELKKIK